MNDEDIHFEEVPPPYFKQSINQIPELPNRNRSISAQIKTSPLNFVTRDRGKSAQPATARSEISTGGHLYPSLSDADLLFIPVENTASECKSIHVYMKEIWEAGLGVHTGIFKKLTKIADNGGETSWRTIKLEWVNNQLIYTENSKTTPIPIKHSSFGVDKNSKAHPHTLTIQQINGKLFKFGFPTLGDLNAWKSFFDQ